MSCFRGLNKLTILLFSISYGSQGLAIDPFTIMAAATATVNAISSFSDAAGEVSSTLGAIDELYSEVSPESEMSADANRISSDIREIEALAIEAGYTAQDIADLKEESPAAAERLSTTIRHITKSVRTAKRAMNIFSKLDQKAQRAQIESTEIEREQLKVMYAQLRAQHKAEIDEIKKELKEKVKKKREIQALRQDLQDRGVKTFSKTGVYSFPKTKPVIEAAIKVGQSMRPLLFGLMLLAFLLRVVFYQIGYRGVGSYGDLLRDALVCSVLLFSYPELIRGIVTICHELGEFVSKASLKEIDPKSWSLGEKTASSGISLNGFPDLLEFVKYYFLRIADFAVNFGLAFLVLLAPLVIFASQILNFSVGWPVYLGTLIVFSLWPLFWNMTGYLAGLLWTQTDKSVWDYLMAALVSLFQFLSPFVGMKIMSGGSGKAVADGVRSGTSILSKQVQGFKSAAIGAGSFSIASAPGAMAGYFASQGFQRMKAGVSAFRGTASHEEKIRNAAFGTSPSKTERFKSAAKAFSFNDESPNRFGAAEFVRGFKKRESNKK